MTISPGRLLVVLAVCLLVNSPAHCSLWPKILILPPVCETGTADKLKEAFQWDMVDVLNKYKYFDVVTQQEYEEYQATHNMAGSDAIPDSVLPQMMADLEAIIYTRSIISQPVGKGTALTAQVTFVYPKGCYMKDDFLMSSRRLSVENEKKSWNLAGECVKAAIKYRKLITTLIKARQSYSFAVSPLVSEKEQLEGILKGALARFRELAELEPNNPDFSYMVALCLTKLGRQDEAIATFSDILARIDSLHVPSREKLAEYYFTHDDLEGALQHFGKLVEIDPGNSSYTRDRAQVLTRLGRKDEAIEAYEKLIRIDDNDDAVRHRLAELYYDKAGRLDAAGDQAAADSLTRMALEDMTRSCELAPPFNDMADPKWLEPQCQRLNFLATLQREVDGSGTEIPILQEIVKLDPSFPGALYNLGVYEHQAANYDEAVDYYSKALDYADAPQKAALNFQLGVIYLKQIKKYPQAIDHFSAALETDYGYTKSMAYFMRGTAYLSYANQLDFANDKAANIDALIGSGTMNHERTARALELYTASLADFRQAIADNPGVVRSARQYVEKITGFQERLGRIDRQIDFKRKTR